MNDGVPTGDDRAAQWWSTAIIDMKPGEIRYRGYAIEELIGNIGFAQMIWLMLRGDLPTDGQARLLEAALMSAVDHGPRAVRDRRSAERVAASPE